MADTTPYPYKPDHDERDNYFHGVSGNPKLMARTSHNRWTKPMFLSSSSDSVGGEMIQHPKYYMTIEDPDTVGKWNERLSASLMTALSQCRWTYYLPIRTSFGSTRHEQEANAASVLLVAVVPGTIEWEDALKIALRCRDVVRGFGIPDLEVEVLEFCH